MNEIERRFRLIIIGVVIVIIGAVIISLLSNNNDSQNSGLAMRELKDDIKIVDKKFKDYAVEDALSRNEDVEGNIDLLAFRAVDAGVTKDLLYVDFIVHELGKEDTLEFVVGYEQLLKEELKSDIPPVQFRLFSSEQHYVEEIPKYVYIDNMLYVQDDKDVENVIEEVDGFEDPYFDSAQIEEDK